VYVRRALTIMVHPSNLWQQGIFPTPTTKISAPQQQGTSRTLVLITATHLTNIRTTTTPTCTPTMDIHHRILIMKAHHRNRNLSTCHHA